MYNSHTMRAIVGNEKANKYILDSLSSGNISHAYLFCGPGNVGKTTLAIEFARNLLCSDGCNDDCTCSNCTLVRLGQHPDLQLVETVEKGGVAELREISKVLELSPYQAKYRVAIIPHVENLSNSALNAFLKTLEEPNPNTVIILTTENRRSILETIISRTRLVTFTHVTDRVLADYLSNNLGKKKDVVPQIVAVSSGRIGLAKRLAEEDGSTLEFTNMATEFFRVFRTNNLYEKVSFATKLNALKTGQKEFLMMEQMYLRRELLVSLRDNTPGRHEVSPRAGKKEVVKIIISALDKLAKAEELAGKNVNSRLIFESLLFRSIS